ncbi:MAG TPA: carboxypeptidase-like regulatory domain-containing protein [Candidatus Acidoferrales bacterium]|nr:carboxypeptidase-like regulatory domain-containing protein [Candidatus Acidoferrales bacterium]
MRERRGLFVAFAFLCLLALVPIGLHAQSADTGLVQGQVTDPTGAVIPGAQASLTNAATGVQLTTTTDSVGRFLFPNVAPGTYVLRVSATGFESYVVTKVTVDVTKSYTYNTQLKLGQTTQTVQVTEVMGAELQTTNASIGTEIGGDTLSRLPSSQRNITSMLSLQPAVAPMNASSDTSGGEVAGATTDQTTFLVDGGDATSDMEATNSYAAVPGQPYPSPFIAVNVETTNEFRVVTSSPTSSFSRSQGGEIAIVSKSGTNSFHGSAYEYYNGSTLGANTWTNNRLAIPKPHQVNNRYGFTFGGPMLKNRLWFFGNYEGRKFRQSGGFETDVPTALARQGILQFTDAKGNVIAYNLKTSTACGSAGTTACDPRGIGIDPTIQAYWNLLPPPNDPSAGDGLNSEGFNHSYAQPTDENMGMLRLDYKINQSWRFYTTYRQQKFSYLDQAQYDLIALQNVSSTPVQPRFATFMLTGQIGNHFTSQIHGSWMRDWWAWGRVAPANPSAISGLGGTLQVSGEGQAGDGTNSKPFADPVNFNTQQGRARLWNGHDWYLAQDSSYLHGNHTIQFGGSWYFWNIIHLRTDDVLGGLTNGPIYWIGSTQMASGLFVNVPSSETPPGLSSTDAARWSTMYASMLGLVDHSSQVATRDGQFNALPLGQPLVDHVHVGAFYNYVQDLWQMKPSFTLTYGLSYGVQFPPRELNGKQVLETYTLTGQPVQDIQAYFQARNQSLSSGGFFPDPAGSGATFPSFSFAPIGSVPGFTRPLNTYWGSLGPRVAVAWQPKYSNRIFGNHQTVVRVGYSILWNRTNAVGLVLTPLLGDGLAQIIGCNAPVINGTCSGATTDATSAFRVGIDGKSLPLPTPTGGFPLTPTSPISSLNGFNLDPKWTPAWSHNVTFDIQRTAFHNWMLDVGYIGRFSRNLERGASIGASDMFATDPKSGQSLAQAFDSVSQQIRGGTKPANVTPQPYFEDMGGACTNAQKVPGTMPGQPGYVTCTNLAATDTSDLSNGNLARFMIFKFDRVANTSLDPLQFRNNFFNFGGGWANYNAGFVTIRKAFSQGLEVGFNYTYSHALGTNTIGQQYINYTDGTPFRPGTAYTSSGYDRRHVFNANFYYQLPFGKGAHFSTGNSFTDRIVGGWYVSGIWSWQSGLPRCIGADGTYGDFNGHTCAVAASPLYGQNGRHNNIVGGALANGTRVATNGNVANGGSGINLFANPVAVYASLTRPLLSQDLRPYQDDVAGFPLWNMDFSIGKNVAATERFKVLFTADLFNAFNHFVPSNPSLDLNSPHSFGVVTDQQNTPRQIQMGLRFEF